MKYVVTIEGEGQNWTALIERSTATGPWPLATVTALRPAPLPTILNEARNVVSRHAFAGDLTPIKASWYAVVLVDGTVDSYHDDSESADARAAAIDGAVWLSLRVPICPSCNLPRVSAADCHEKA